MLDIASFLLLLMALTHSYPGERTILIRFFNRGNLPKVLGSTAFTVGSLRFVWHLLTVACAALAFLVVLAARGRP